MLVWISDSSRGIWVALLKSYRTEYVCQCWRGSWRYQRLMLLRSSLSLARFVVHRAALAKNLEGASCTDDRIHGLQAEAVSVYWQRDRYWTKILPMPIFLSCRGSIQTRFPEFLRFWVNCRWIRRVHDNNKKRLDMSKGFFSFESNFGILLAFPYLTNTQL